MKRATTLADGLLRGNGMVHQRGQAISRLPCFYALSQSDFPGGDADDHAAVFASKMTGDERGVGGHDEVHWGSPMRESLKKALTAPDEGSRSRRRRVIRLLTERWLTKSASPFW